MGPYRGFLPNTLMYSASPPLANALACLIQSSRSMRPLNESSSSTIPISAFFHFAIWAKCQKPRSFKVFSSFGPTPAINFRSSAFPFGFFKRSGPLVLAAAGFFAAVLAGAFLVAVAEAVLAFADGLGAVFLAGAPVFLAAAAFVVAGLVVADLAPVFVVAAFLAAGFFAAGFLAVVDLAAAVRFGAAADFATVLVADLPAGFLAGAFFVVFCAAGFCVDFFAGAGFAAGSDLDRSATAAGRELLAAFSEALPLSEVFVAPDAFEVSELTGADLDCISSIGLDGVCLPKYQYRRNRRIMISMIRPIAIKLITKPFSFFAVSPYKVAPLLI